jgi:putative transposase
MLSAPGNRRIKNRAAGAIPAEKGDASLFCDLSRAQAAAHTRYAQRLNRSRGRHGHVWQGRFFSSPLDEASLWAALRYVERNPVRARMVRRAETYAWSSAAAHCGRRADAVLTQAPAWRDLLAAVTDWSA